VPILIRVVVKSVVEQGEIPNRGLNFIGCLDVYYDDRFDGWQGARKVAKIGRR
jgi:hypothetical protein